MTAQQPLAGYSTRSYPFPTKRYCQTLDLRDDPALIAEYRRLHSKEGVWQEVLDGIRAVGILEMDIYLLGTRLFMVVETPRDFDWAARMAELSQLPRQQEWEALTGRYQKTAEGATSDEKWQMMERIFRLYEK